MKRHFQELDQDSITIQEVIKNTKPNQNRIETHKKNMNRLICEKETNAPIKISIKHI